MVSVLVLLGLLEVPDHPDHEPPEHEPAAAAAQEAATVAELARRELVVWMVMGLFSGVRGTVAASEGEVNPLGRKR